VNSLQSLSCNFALDIERLDKQKAKTAEGTHGYLHLCQEQHAVIVRLIEDPQLAHDQSCWGYVIPAYRKSFDLYMMIPMEMETIAA